MFFSSNESLSNDDQGLPHHVRLDKSRSSSPTSTTPTSTTSTSSSTTTNKRTSENDLPNVSTSSTSGVSTAATTVISPEPEVQKKWHRDLIPVLNESTQREFFVDSTTTNFVTDIENINNNNNNQSVLSSSSYLVPTSPKTPVTPATVPEPGNFVRVFVGTWNMMGKMVSSTSNQPLHPFIVKDTHHIYAIATQECERSIEASFLNQSKAKWESALKNALGSNYVMIKSHTLVAIHLAVFVRSELVPLLKDVRSSHVSTGLFNAVGNKGGVGVSFKLGSTSYLFVASHLAAHQDKVQARNADFQKISKELRGVLTQEQLKNYNPEKESITDKFDRVFFFGDLNYRINGNRKVMDACLVADFHEVMLANDQLSIEKKKGNAFLGFREGQIHFRPTYKMGVGKKQKNQQDKGGVIARKNSVTKFHQRGAKSDISFATTSSILSSTSATSTNLIHGGVGENETVAADDVSSTCSSTNDGGDEDLAEEENHLNQQQQQQQDQPNETEQQENNSTATTTMTNSSIISSDSSTSNYSVHSFRSLKPLPSYDKSKKLRIPAWTDRILFRCNDEKIQVERKEEEEERTTRLKLLEYDSCEEITISDHRPVFARFLSFISRGDVEALWNRKHSKESHKLGKIEEEEEDNNNNKESQDQEQEQSSEANSKVCLLS